MKVVHIVEAFGGGIITFIKNLTEGLDYEHTIFYAQREISIDEIKKQFKSNIKFINWTYANREISIYKDIKAAIELYNFLKTDDFDVIHLHSSKAGVIGRVVGLFFLDKTIIYTPNGASFARKDISSLKVYIYKFIEFFVSLISGNVVCVSNSEAILFNNLGVKSIYINNGIKIKNKNKPKKNSQNFKIITVGRISNQKDPYSFNRIAQEFIEYPVDFLWVGDGELRDILSSPNIFVTGWLSSVEVEEKLLDSDLYISTALWEGLPFAVLEAMNCKLPLLLSECIGNVDLVENDTNGYIFKTEKEAIAYISKYINSYKTLKVHGDNSYRKLRNEFDVNKMCDEYKAVYRMKL
ncbi:MAG: glycosyltransferase [Spirosomataceae bacterium]